MRRILILSAFLVLAACATPKTQTPTIQDAALRAEQERQQDLIFERDLSHKMRLLTVSHRLKTANLDLCKDEQGAEFGFSYVLAEEINRDHHPAWKRHLPIGEVPVIDIVVAGRPADQAGLQRGDLIRSFNNMKPRPEKGPREWRRMLDRRLDDIKPLALQIDRKGSLETIDITPVAGCASTVLFVDEPDINATADGDTVRVTRGMMEFVESDDEIAFVVGHELAHNHMDHIGAKRTNSIAGGIGGLAIDVLFAAAGVNTNGAFMRSGMNAGAASYSVDFEKEADYVGLYYAERAGFDTSQVGDFWRRLAINDPKRTTHRNSHPTTPERFLAIDETRKEISAKLETGTALLPNMKK